MSLLLISKDSENIILGYVAQLEHVEKFAGTLSIIRSIENEFVFMSRVHEGEWIEVYKYIISKTTPLYGNDKRCITDLRLRLTAYKNNQGPHIFAYTPMQDKTYMLCGAHKNICKYNADLEDEALYFVGCDCVLFE
jgi:hypothetical protein